MGYNCRIEGFWHKVEKGRETILSKLMTLEQLELKGIHNKRMLYSREDLQTQNTLNI